MPNIFTDSDVCELGVTFTPEFADRSILWNSVEQIEKARDSQLAREIEAALPRELSGEQQLALVRAYVKDNFVDKGMCADFAIHDKGTVFQAAAGDPLQNRTAHIANTNKSNGIHVHSPSFFFCRKYPYREILPDNISFLLYCKLHKIARETQNKACVQNKPPVFSADCLKNPQTSYWICRRICNLTALRDFVFPRYAKQKSGRTFARPPLFSILLQFH